jgi:hypothetical protein
MVAEAVGDDPGVRRDYRRIAFGHLPQPLSHLAVFLRELAVTSRVITVFVAASAVVGS